VALAAAARATPGLKPVTTERRDLFKRPLVAAELAAFDAVVLDPPRAGARAQAEQLAASGMQRVVCVSCDADSFARDAAVLLAGGYRCSGVLPVDQFPWSDHIELVATFERLSARSKR
jgi:23S rRNA (uracil1939-C5)-methyltransferase